MIGPIDRVVRSYPRAFFQSLREHIDAAFSETYGLTISRFEEPEYSMIRGQIRHALCEVAFRRAAEEAGLDCESVHTKPAGGRFVLVVCEGVSLIRCNVQTHCGVPRPAVFRKENAAQNAYLSSTQLDFLKSNPAPSEAHMCAMLVVTVDPRDQSVPAFIGIGIPRADLSDWLVREPITDILARYHDIDDAAHSPRDIDVKVRDSAIPKLKKDVTKKG